MRIRPLILRPAASRAAGGRGCQPRRGLAFVAGHLGTGLALAGHEHSYPARAVISVVRPTGRGFCPPPLFPRFATLSPAAIYSIAGYD